MSEVEIVKKNYDDNAEVEWKRLEGFHFEFEITKVMLRRHMKKGTVLDIGGGPGRYAIYLAKLGYDVTLVDLSDKSIELARIKAQEYGVSIKAYQCDARELSKLNLTRFDNVLVMGPLYHLFKESDRKQCIEQAKKHLKDDGVLFASFISITGGLNYYLDECPDQLVNIPAMDLFDCMERDESWSGAAFTAATFVNNLHIEPFFASLGCEKITLFGQEGITGMRLSFLEKCSDEVKDLYLRLSIKLYENPQYFVYSNHLMYVGRMRQ